MIAAVVGFLKSYWKPLVYVALVGILLYAIKLWGVHQYDLGQERGKTDETKQLQKQIDTAVADERAKTAIDRDVLTRAAQSLRSARAAFNTDRLMQSSIVNSNLDDISKKLSEAQYEVLSVSASDLPDYIRQLNRELRSNVIKSEAAIDYIRTIDSAVKQ